MKKLFFLSDWFYLLSFLANLGERDAFNLTQNLPSLGAWRIEHDVIHNVRLFVLYTNDGDLINTLDSKFTNTKFVIENENIITSSIMPIEK